MPAQKVSATGITGQFHIRVHLCLRPPCRLRGGLKRLTLLPWFPVGFSGGAAPSPLCPPHVEVGLAGLRPVPLSTQGHVPSPQLLEPHTRSLGLQSLGSMPSPGLGRPSDVQPLSQKTWTQGWSPSSPGHITEPLRRGGVCPSGPSRGRADICKGKEQPAAQVLRW